MLETTSQHIPTIQNVSCFVMGERSMSAMARIGRNSHQGTAIRSISRMVRLKKVLKIAKILDQTSAGKNEAI